MAAVSISSSGSGHLASPVAAIGKPAEALIVVGYLGSVDGYHVNFGCLRIQERGLSTRVFLGVQVTRKQARSRF